MAQSVKRPTLFGSGHDLKVLGFASHIRLSAFSTETALDPVSPSLSLLISARALSVSKINIKKTNKNKTKIFFHIK